MSGRRLPFSVRLSVWYGVSLLILLSVFVIFLYTSFDLSVHRDFSDQMDEAQRILVSAIDTESEVLTLIPSEAVESVAYRTRGGNGTYVRILSIEGGPIYASPNFANDDIFTPLLPATESTYVHNHEWGGLPVRSLYSPLRDNKGELRGWLEITRLESSIHRELHRLEWILAIGVILGVLVAIASGYSLAKRALRPVVVLTDAANQIRLTNAEHRLPSDFGVKDELSDLAHTFNVMLDRFQSSFKRERRFRADAAHEMFTPLSAMQSEIDVALHRSREPAYYRQTLQTVRDRTEGLSETLDGLLELSSAEGIENVVSKKVNLSSLVIERLKQIEGLVKEKHVTLEFDVSSDMYVMCDSGHIESILDNLISNAVKYTSEGGKICIQAHSDGVETVTRISDSGIGFTESERGHLFDRFFRSDDPCVQRTRGNGLGLSIVKALVETYGGSITASSPGRSAGSIFEVRLPSGIATIS